jgi:DNA helicase-2/ATP-dependent DNA helicase PcrA
MTAQFSATRLAELLGLPAPTDEQAAVIESPLQPGVVIAGAGSGKTETMASRVVWLVANRYVEPGAVLGLTFTRKAAAELGSRIRRRLAQWQRVVRQVSPDDTGRIAELMAGEPTVSTYAAYAGRLVGEHAIRVGAEPNPRLLSEAVRWQLADAVVRRFPGPLPSNIGALSSIARYVLRLADQLADHLVTAEQVEAFCDGLLAEWEALPDAPRARSRTPGDTKLFVPATEHRRELMQLVRDFASAKGVAVDFGDQMALAAAVAGVSAVADIERQRYRAVLLDEYQDTGHAQTVMLAGLFGNAHPVTAVGDPFQSIYGWRGASAGTIESFGRFFPTAGGAPAPTYPLSISWRNDRAVLDAANDVAGPLRAASSATVVLRPSAKAVPGEVRVARTVTHFDEAMWVAERLHQAWAASPPGERTAAVLVRRRSQIPVLADALYAIGLPVEIVGLGGLLTTPEVVDVVATLRVIADHRASTALMRLLTGARWRIGGPDLVALHRRARHLAGRSDGRSEGMDSADEPVTIVEALDDLGEPSRYSPVGYTRLSALVRELRALRRRISAPLTELVAEVERTIGVDIEVGARAGSGRVNLDRFLDEAARFAADSDETTLRAFLAFLEAAEDEENGLEQGEVEVAAERVQLLTVHGAKGLEWDVVAVPGLMDDVFPARASGIDWTRSRDELPAPLRGDRTELPLFSLSGAGDRKEVDKRLKRHSAEVGQQHAAEERRLAYVALTRARHTLLASAYIWDGTKTPRAASPFLLEVRERAVLDEWADDPLEGDIGPLADQVISASWPQDPLGTRRADVEAGAVLVRAARAKIAPRVLAAPMPGLLDEASDRISGWERDVDLLLAERARRRSGDTIEVVLPDHLSVSDLVALRRDPAELARRLRRPLPSRPAPLARRGTAFHAWLEQRWSAQALLDLDDLPGSADETANDEELDQLQAAFERSEWATRTPAEVEVGFDMSIAGVVVRGRMDAVFGEDNGWTVVDWKTGARPTGRDADAAAVQLAAYRLAWARLKGIAEDQLDSVQAAFHYVRSNETVRPVDLLDSEGLQALVAARRAQSDYRR